MASEFERDTAVEQSSNNTWTGQLSDGWCIGPVPNGGYVMAVVARALQQALPHKDPLSVTAHYLAPTVPGPFEVEVEILRSGGSTSYAMGRLRQDGELKVQLTAAYTDMDRLNGETRILKPIPAMPGFEECFQLPPTEHMSFRSRVVQKVVPGQEKNFLGSPDGGGEWLGWTALIDGADIDAIALLMFSDGFPPPVFTLVGPVGWVPTLELTVQVRAKPVPGPLRVRFYSNYLTNGIIEEDGEIWDSADNLVALSRQTAKVRIQ